MSSNPTLSPTPAKAEPPSNRAILALALPIVLSNVSEQVLGLVDTAVIGRLGSATSLGAIAMGSALFALLFWAFGFLRMSTTGLIAQASGQQDDLGVRATLVRGLGLGLLVGVGLIILQAPLGWAVFHVFAGSVGVEAQASEYYSIRIWSAPFTLANYVIAGCLIGLGKTSLALAHQLVLNSINIVLDIAFVVGFGWGVAGVAAGTVIAALCACLVGLWLVHVALRASGFSGLLAPLPGTIVLARDALRRMLSVNADIMVRTLLLIAIWTFFMNEGARQGDVVIAANGVLFQFILFAAFFLDGFAIATETLVGRAVGTKRRAEARAAAKAISIWAVGAAFAISAGLALVGPAAITFLTTATDVQTAAKAFLIYTILAPLFAVAAFQFDGIFLGATWSRPMRDAAIESTCVFLASWAVLVPLAGLGNHGLWMAVSIWFVARGICLGRRYPRLEAAIAPQPEKSGVSG
ncbi:MAG: MATE family efflux transporter [Pseudomonadota bacterium]